MPAWQRIEVVGPVTLYLGDCLQVMPEVGVVDHMIMDPPYEAETHTAKAKAGSVRRVDGGAEFQALNFDCINEIRDDVVAMGRFSRNWFIAFCQGEGIGRWADCINASPMRYKRACHWIKPDAAPQMNGQGPAQGAEHFVCAWAGKGYSKWNGGGKRGVYTHNTNSRYRTGGHPTEKPIELMREIILDFTQPGDLIADLFMGSGTTLVACAQTGRRGIGIESNAQYFDLALARVRKAVAYAAQLGVQPAANVQADFLNQFGG